MQAWQQWAIPFKGLKDKTCQPRMCYGIAPVKNDKMDCLNVKKVLLYKNANKRMKATYIKNSQH